MNISAFIRTGDWWDHKLPPILGIGYATLLLYDQNLFNASGHIVIILLSVIIGAIYVSIINDISDVEVDARAGKPNKMASLPVFVKWLLPIICIACGICFIAFFYYPDWLSCIFYTIPWIAFSMYSLPPFRLKNRGIWGVLADASGAHIFINLLMVSSLSYISKHPINWFWLLAIGVWATCGGIRGIMWHQFTDRDNDIKSGIETFATRREAKDFRYIEWVLLLIESIALFYVIYTLSITLVYYSFIAYLILMLLRFKVLHQEPISFLHKTSNYQTLLLDFTDLFLPAALLVYSSFHQPKAWILLLIQLLLFPGRWILILKDCYRILFKKRWSKQL
ncbi:UbiA family prenyltransferase [Niabella hibiscisoli]|uniref:UbiA family prenyltransferase n=1 Tax=Niabella hibiscisoli TaxID=1825928 RepID=UPI001F0D652F|nr:UbiA family prenyltransferase [Niabella hibiscisoli]MCH5718711.1 UbiA family prenyltransferase [Niabella hibiscisoli]